MNVRNRLGNLLWRWSPCCWALAFEEQEAELAPLKDGIGHHNWTQLEKSLGVAYGIV